MKNAEELNAKTKPTNPLVRTHHRTTWLMFFMQREWPIKWQIKTSDVYWQIKRARLAGSKFNGGGPDLFSVQFCCRYYGSFSLSFCFVRCRFGVCFSMALTWPLSALQIVIVHVRAAKVRFWSQCLRTSQHRSDSPMTFHLTASWL